MYILQKALKQDLILQLLGILDTIKKGHYRKKKVIGLMKDELGGKIMTDIAALRTKTHSYLTDDNDENKKAKGTKNSRKQ